MPAVSTTPMTCLPFVGKVELPLSLQSPATPVEACTKCPTVEMPSKTHEAIPEDCTVTGWLLLAVEVKTPMSPEVCDTVLASTSCEPNRSASFFAVQPPLQVNVLTE
jgi:hypothetical protein